MDLTNVKTREMKFRPSFGLMMKELLAAREDVVFVVADSARAARFVCPEEYKNRFVECGIAEQNMISVAAGLARTGLTPIVFAFSPFSCERGFEQVRLDLAYSNLHVIIVGSEGGVGMGTQGVTHYGWEDMAVMRSLPGMTVMNPVDHVAMYKCMETALDLKGPVYIRLSGGVPKAVYDEDVSFEKGGSHELRSGKDGCVMAIGTMVQTAMEAAKLLEEKGLSISVVDMYSLKPLDKECVLRYAKSAPAIITLEEHTVINALGSAVADVLAMAGHAAPLTKIGLPDEYPHCVSPYAIMLADYGLTPPQVAETVEKAILAAR